MAWLFEKSATWRHIVKATRVRRLCTPPARGATTGGISPAVGLTDSSSSADAVWSGMGRQDSPSKFLAFGIVVGVVIPYIATDALISVRKPLSRITPLAAHNPTACQNQQQPALVPRVHDGESCESSE
jgi:hypothetical protein